MIRTEPVLDDAVSQASSDEQPYEQFACPFHPRYKLQVLCTKEGFNPSLLCIGCLIDPTNEKRLKGENLGGENIVPIHDIIIKGVTTSSRSATPIQFAKENIEQRFAEFSSRDYVGIYERHVEGQMKRLDREIGKIKDSLEDLRFQFKTFFEKQVDYLKGKEEELKSKVNEYVDEREKIENLRFSSPEEIIDEIKNITDIRDYERFIKMLYHRGYANAGLGNSSMLQGVLDLMNTLKERVSVMKTSKIDTGKLEEIRKNLDSIETLDQSLQPFPANLNPKLEQTLEKIRNVERKSTPKNKLKGETDSGYHSADKYLQKRSDFEEALQERLSNPERRDMHDMHDEPLSPVPEPNIIIRHPEKHDDKVDVNQQAQTVQQPQQVQTAQQPQQAQTVHQPQQTQTVQQHHEPILHDQIMIEEPQQHFIGEQHFAHEPQFKGVDSATQTLSTMSVGTNTSRDEPYYKRFDEEEAPRRHRSTFLPAIRRDRDVITHTQRSTEVMIEEEEEEEYNTPDERDMPHAVEFPDDREFTFSDRTPEPRKKVKLNKPTPNLSANSHKTKSRTPKQEAPKSAHKQHSSHQHSSHAHHARDSQAHHPTLDHYLTKPEHKEKYSHSHSHRKENPAHDHHYDEPYVDNGDAASLTDQNETQEAFHEDRSEDDTSVPSRTPKKIIDRGIQGLHDWINRRVTGYLIFQNTLHDVKNSDKEKEGDHLNRITGQRWKKLTKTEKEEYKSLAMNARVDLKKEFKDVDKDAPEFTELQELVDQKIKKVKKE